MKKKLEEEERRRRRPKRPCVGLCQYYRSMGIANPREDDYDV